MTNLVLQYLGYKEEVRSNQARESETYRHDLAMENLSALELAERARHNIVTEKVSWYDATTRRYSQQESARHDKATESISLLELAEKVRSDKAQEALKATQMRQDYYVEWSKLQLEKAKTTAQIAKVQKEIDNLTTQWSFTAQDVKTRRMQAETAAVKAANDQSNKIEDRKLEARKVDINEKIQWFNQWTGIQNVKLKTGELGLKFEDLEVKKDKTVFDIVNSMLNPLDWAKIIK